MPELLFTSLLTAALFSGLTWHFTSRYYLRRIAEERPPIDPPKGPRRIY